MSRSDTVRYRVSDEERAELEELRQWLNVRTLSQVIRQGLDALKEESGFNLRNGDVGEPRGIPRSPAAVVAEHFAQQDAGAGHALPAFVPGIVATEGDT